MKHQATYIRSAFVSILLLIYSYNLSAQESYNTKGFSIGGGAGILIFRGDIGENTDVSDFSRIRTGYHATLSKRFTPWLGISASALSGKLSQSERSTTRNLNFESKLQQAELNLVFHFDNGFMMDEDASVAPYISAGIGYMMFDPFTDLKDANGNLYYYWNDGGIYNLPQTVANYNNPGRTTLKRDYTYETPLKDSTTNYAKSSLFIPLGFGLQMKLTDHFNVNLGVSYYMSMTDYIDNFKTGSGNDSYFYSSVGLNYQFFSKAESKEMKAYKEVDFAKIDQQDTDGDGVRDDKDNCQNSPKGVKVDANGCPLDTDGDGVPDYRDKEANSKKKTLVDEDGITLTDAMIAERARRDSVAKERETQFENAPSLTTLKEIEKKATTEKAKTAAPARKLPSKYEFGDKNKDGYISSDEITAVIDSFFDGSAEVTVELINELIDYFFEQ